MVLLLDNSPIHCKKADDCLNAKAMNVNSGGKQPLMRDGFYFRDDERVRIIENLVEDDCRGNPDQVSVFLIDIGIGNKRKRGNEARSFP